MGRKLYFIDSYGNVQRDRKAEHASRKSKGGGKSRARFAFYALVALAALMVLAHVI